MRLSGDVLAPLSAPSSELRSITLAWAKQRWSYGSGGTPEVVRNSDPNFGKDVLIGWQGVKHAISKANQPELRLIPHIPEIVHGAKLDLSEPAKLGRAHIKQAHFLSALVELDGETLTIGIVVHETASGQMFYDQFIIKDGAQKHAPPLGISGNGMPGELSDRSVLQPHGGGEAIVNPATGDGNVTMTKAIGMPPVIRIRLPGDEA